MKAALTHSIMYRRAKPEDTSAVARVQVDTWRACFSETIPQPFLDKLSYEDRAADFERRLANRGAFYELFLAQDRREIVGFADFGLPRGDLGSYESELYALYILPAYHRQGIGTTLTRMGVNSIVRSGRNSMAVLALEANPYRPFYGKLGGQLFQSGSLEIDGKTYPLVGYGWPDLAEMLRTMPSPPFAGIGR
jgi:ribosomal protein S18 acetylase RimI-like enzyme